MDGISDFAYERGKVDGFMKGAFIASSVTVLVWVCVYLFHYASAPTLMTLPRGFVDNCLDVEDPTRRQTVARAVIVVDVVDGEFENYRCESAVAGDGAPEAPAE